MIFRVVGEGTEALEWLSVTVEECCLKKSSMQVCLVPCVKVELGSVWKGLFLSAFAAFDSTVSPTQEVLEVG